MITAMLIAGAAALTAWVSTDKSRQAGSDVSQAMSNAGVPQKVAAAVMGLSESQLTEQLAARQPMNFFRMVELFEAFPQVEIELDNLRAARRGLFFIDRPELAEIVRVAATFKRFLRARSRVARTDVVRDVVVSA